MRWRSVLAASLVAVLTGATVAVAQLEPGGTFTDDDGNVHEGNIEAIAAEGITQGCNPPVNDRYCPVESVTRGQMAAFLVRALGLAAADHGGFEDTTGSVFADEIERLAAAGITRGCNPPSNDRFCPEESVTRGQMAAFLVRAMEYDDPGTGDYFNDDDGSVFESDIDRLRAAGVTAGCNPPANDRYCPDQPVQRDQMASFLARALGLEPTTPPPTSTTTTMPPPGEENYCAGLGDVDDDLTVPAGESCSLAGNSVGGNIIVGSGSMLDASGVDVEGNVQAENHAAVTVRNDSFVDGDIQAYDGGSVTVTSTQVGGNVQLEGNDGSIVVTGNLVDGDIQVNDNSGGAEISDNTVGGNLQCEGNQPPPSGGGNDVSGDKEDQCSGL